MKFLCAVTAIFFAAQAQTGKSTDSTVRAFSVLKD